MPADTSQHHQEKKRIVFESHRLHSVGATLIRCNYKYICHISCFCNGHMLICYVQRWLQMPRIESDATNSEPRHRLGDSIAMERRHDFDVEAPTGQARGRQPHSDQHTRWCRRPHSIGWPRGARGARAVRTTGKKVPGHRQLSSGRALAQPFRQHYGPPILGANPELTKRVAYSQHPEA